MDKKTISLCMIVKNEADTLSNCLESVSGIFDEIVIVDTGSTDETVSIAEEYADKVLRFEWGDDFSAARNFAFSEATSDYLMWLDADDVLLPDDREKLGRVIAQLDGRVQEYAALYNVGFDEHGAVSFSYYRERIVLRESGLRFSGRVHEAMPLLADCVYTDFAVTHKKVHPTEKGRNLRIYESMLKEGKRLSAREQFYYARELFYNDRITFAATAFEAFLDRKDGFVENKIDACKMLSLCAQVLGQDALPPLLRSFEYDCPRAEICCEIGKIFMARGEDTRAIYWYEEALHKKPSTKSGGFYEADCYGFVPLLQLCVLYYRAGDVDRAKSYNDRAGVLKPSHASVRNNKDFFLKLNLNGEQNESI